MILVQKERGPDSGRRYAMKVLKKAMIVVCPKCFNTGADHFRLFDWYNRKIGGTLIKIYVANEMHLLILALVDFIHSA